MNLIRVNLKTFPDLSALTKDELHLNNTFVRIVPEDFLPRGIRHLDLKNNCIESDGLPILFPNTIETLELDGNRICDFRDVQQFPPHLKTLNLYDNPIYSLEDIYSILSLEKLNVGKTNLEIISLLPRFLQYLNACKCYRLRMLPNRLPTTLRVATLNDCSLRYASLPGNWGTSLEELNLAYNDIERFPRNLPPTLKTLNLTHNRIRELPDDFNRKFPNLEVCLLASNKIRTVPVEERRKKLALVDIRDNELIAHLDPERIWASVLLDEKNWTGDVYIFWAKRIQKNWRISALKRRVRTWRRIRGLKEELMCVSMMPERVWQTDVISPEWKRA